MNLENNGRARVLCLHAAAKRLQIPERTLRYRASRGRIEGAFKQGKLWKFPLTALESGPGKRVLAIGLVVVSVWYLPHSQLVDAPCVAGGAPASAEIVR